MKGLWRYTGMVSALEIASDLVQRRQPGDHGAERRLEETGGSKFMGSTDDWPRIATSDRQARLLLGDAECLTQARRPSRR